MLPPKAGEEGGAFEGAAEAASREAAKLVFGARKHGVRGIEIEQHEPPARLRPAPGGGEFLAPEFFQVAEKSVHAIIVSVFGESFRASGRGDAGTRIFVVEIAADERRKLRFPLVADEMDARDKTEGSEFAGERGDEQRAGGKRFKDAEVGVLGKVVAADVHDDARAAIDFGNFLKIVTARPVVGLELRGKPGEPFRAAAIDWTGNLADPAEIEVAIDVRQIEVLAMNRVREKHRAWMRIAPAKPLFETRMTDGNVIEKRRPADAPLGESIGVHVQTNGGDGALQDAFRQKRKGAFGKEEIVRRFREAGEKRLEAGVERDGPIEKLNFHAAFAEGAGVGRKHDPTAVFGSEAENQHDEEFRAGASEAAIFCECANKQRSGSFGKR